MIVHASLRRRPYCRSSGSAACLGFVASPTVAIFSLCSLLAVVTVTGFALGGTGTAIGAAARTCAVGAGRRRRATLPSAARSLTVATPTKMNSQSSSSSSSLPAKKKKVAVIGGGIAGLSFAERLTKQVPSRFDVTVFDTGRVRPGGRCSSRQPHHRPKDDLVEAEQVHPILSKFRYDHAAQVISIDAERFPEFAEQVQQRWVPAGIVRPFPPRSLFRIESATRRFDMQQSVMESTEKDQHDAPSSPSSVPAYYYALKGMGSLVTDGMIAQSGGLYSVRQDVWISPNNGVKYSSNKDSDGFACGQKWTLQAKGRVQGRFDEIVIAHNGKCADRLMSQTPAKKVHQLLRVKFDSTAPDVSNKMILNSLYSWTFCLPKSSSSVLSKAFGDDAATFMCGFVENCDNIKFLTCQTNKLDQDNDCRESEKYEVWTVLSSPEFAKAHKAPQESLGQEVVSNVTRMLGESLERYLQLPPTSLMSSIADQRLQLWGAGLPLNTHRNDGSGFVYDSDFGVGVCGDWLVDPSLAGAWTSGQRLADHLLSDSESCTQGLGKEVAFDRSGAAAKAGIGSLQGAPSSSEPVIASSAKSVAASAARSPSPRTASTLPSRRRARPRMPSQ